MAAQEVRSALSLEDWERLEHALFDGAGEALIQLRDCARGVFHSPVAFLIASAQGALTCLPGNVTFDAGVGPGSVNLFTLLVGRPGEGKDSLMNNVERVLNVSDGDRPLSPKRLQLGSGEGIVSALQPEDGASVSQPVLFGVSEAGALETLMARQGSTLQETLLQVYSGGALGFTNKTEQVSVPANSYTAGVWVGVQPDKAGAILNGPDNGFRHRWVWTELVDPLRQEHYPHAPDKLRPIYVPPALMRGEPFRFAEQIKEETRQSRHMARKYGVERGNKGHRHQTRLKLACGLALLRSSEHVDMDDWRRAGVLMEYSDRVSQRCADHLKHRAAEEEAERITAKQHAQELADAEKVNKARAKLLHALHDHPGEAEGGWVRLSPMRQQARRYREEFDIVCEDYRQASVIERYVDGQTVWVRRGLQFNRELARRVQ